MWLSHETIIIPAIFCQYISNERKIHQLREKNLAWSCFKTQMWRDLILQNCPANFTFWWDTMTKDLTSRSRVILFKVLSVDKLCPVKFVQWLIKRKIWKDWKSPHDFILRLHLLFNLTALYLTFEINFICDLAKENIIRHLSIELINAAWHF